METYEISDKLLELKADLRAELVARELIEMQNPGDAVLLVPAGAFNRSGARDVIAVSDENVEQGNPYIKISTSREGIPDMLPPGVIFQPTISRQERSTETVLEEIDYYETGIQQARTFFAPFDIEFGRQRVALETFEHHSVTDTLAYFNTELFDYLWTGTRLPLSTAQEETILEITMIAHHIVGDLPACQVYFEKLLGQKVCLERGKEVAALSDFSNGMMPLGQGLLGVDWILYGKYVDPDAIRISVGPVPDDALMQFRSHAPEGKSYRILQFLCDLLLPADCSWELHLIAEKGFFQISKTRETGILGYSTIL